jgi:hypothetical protein
MVLTYCTIYFDISKLKFLGMFFCCVPVYELFHYLLIALNLSSGFKTHKVLLEHFITLHGLFIMRYPSIQQPCVYQKFSYLLTFKTYNLIACLLITQPLSSLFLHYQSDIKHLLLILFKQNQYPMTLDRTIKGNKKSFQMNLYFFRKSH